MNHFKLSATIFFSLICYSYYAQSWKTVGLGTGMDARVRALLSDSATNTLIATGQFTKGDVIPTQEWMSWNGSEYHSIVGIQHPNIMTVDTINNLLYVAISGTGGTPITVWDGTTWSQLGTGYGAYCMCMYKGELYISHFPNHHLKKWTGSTFVDVGVNIPDGYIGGLAVFQGNLYATGNFTQLVDQTPAKGIAKFDGNDWSPVSFTGVGGSLLVASDSMLYFGTGFLGGLNFYDGNTWTSIPGVNAYGVNMIWYNGDLYVAGVFSAIGGVAANNIAKWDGQIWSPLGEGITGGYLGIRALAVYNGELYVGGSFTSAGGIPVSNIASWNGTSWSAPPQGLSTSYSDGVEWLVEFNCELMISGFITGTVGVKTNYVAQYNGYKWDSLGGGANFHVLALTKWNGNIVVGGLFTSIGNVSANRVAVWNGTNYSALGAGIGPGQVYALAVYNGELYVGGNFQTAGSSNISYIAKWNGAVWDPVGDGLDERVYALTVYNGELYAGGAFSASGTQMVNGIAKWNGSTWMPLAGGTNGEVKSLCIHNNKLYAGGAFSSPGNNIAKWDGTSWTTLGTGANNDVLALASFNGQLYAGGGFGSAGGNLGCKFIARWNDTTWQSLGGGMNSIVDAIASYNNSLFAGGLFTYTNQTMNYIAKWGGPAQAPNASINSCKGNDICDNGCFIFTDVSMNSPTTRQWSFPGGSPGSSTLASPHVCYDTLGTYPVTLIVSNSLGSDTVVQNITISPVPAAPVITMSGNDLVSSSVTDNQWYFNNLIIPGAVSQTYTPVQSGFYSVSVTNTYGCSSMSPTFDNSPPTAIFTTSLPCVGDSITLTDHSIHNPTFWNWTMTGGVPASSSSQNPSVTYSTAGTHIVTLIAANSFGNGSPVSDTITVNPVPPVPTINQSGITLFSSSNYDNVWFFNGVMINGATQPSYTATANGSYTVVVTNSFNCKSTSAPTTVLTLGISSNSGNDMLTVIPNPSQGIVTINFVSERELENIEVFNDLGQLVYNETITDCQYDCNKIIDMSSFNQGIYLFKIISNENIQLKKVLWIK